MTSTHRPPNPVPRRAAVPLRADGVRVRFPGGPAEVLRGVDLALDAGTTTTLVGVNGCGKSTLLRALAGSQPLSGGRVLLDAEDLTTHRRRAAARRVAVVHQVLPPVPGMRVADLVDLGRYARAGMLGMAGPVRRDVVDTALASVGLPDHGGRLVDTLSGGERQRVRIAAALVQDPAVLLLDEPTAHLDVRHQLGVLDLVRDVSAQRDLTVLMVLHDLDHAMRYSDRIVVLDGGVVAAAGAPGDVVTAELVRRVFGVEARILHDGSGRGPAVAVDRVAAEH